MSSFHTERTSPVAGFWAWLLGLFGLRRPAAPRLMERSAPPRTPAASPVAAPAAKPSSAEPAALPTPVTELDGKLDELIAMATMDNDKLLLEMLQQAVRAHEIDLPRLPALTEELLRLGVDGLEDAKRIAELCRRDQDVTACVVHTANSAVYGTSRCSSLQQAVNRLGIPLVREIALGVSMQNVVYAVPGYESEARKLADDALRCAMAAHHLAKATHRDAGPAYLSGLFADVGRVLLLRNLSKLRTRTRGGRASHLLVKRLDKQLHVGLGRWYAQERNLPPEVCKAIADHHYPTEEWSGIVWALQTLELDDDLRNGGEPGFWPDCAPRIELAREALEKVGESVRPG